MAQEEESKLREEYIAQAVWYILRARYKKPPIDSYLNILTTIKGGKETKTADKLREELLAMLRKE